jgi:hypothetical protein
MRTHLYGGSHQQLAVAPNHRVRPLASDIRYPFPLPLPSPQQQQIPHSYWTHTGLILRPHVRNTYRRIHGTYAFGLWYQVKETPIMSPCSIDTKCPSSAVRTRVLPALLALLRRSLSQHQSVPRILDVRYARYRHSVWPYLASR